MKHILVDSCAHCPLRRSNLKSDCPVTNYPEEERIIHKDCPLEDAPNPIDTEKIKNSFIQIAKSSIDHATELVKQINNL